VVDELVEIAADSDRETVIPDGLPANSNG